MNLTVTNGTTDNVVIDNYTLVEKQLRKQYGLWIHPHWYQYLHVIDSTNDLLFTGIGAYITLVCVMGSIASLAVIVITASLPSLRTLPNILVVDLAVSDMIFALFCGFPMMGTACFRRKWSWSDSGCQWYAFISAVTGLNSINCLTCIAIDRYLVITCRRTTNRTVLMIVGSLAWALTWATPPMFGWSRYIGEGLMISCTYDYLTRTPSNIAFNYCLMGFQFLLPMLIIVCCYVGIVRAAVRCAKSLKKVTWHQSLANAVVEEQERDRRQQELMSYEYRLAKIAAVMIGLFVLAWLPYATVAQIGIAGLQQYVTPFAAEIPIMLAKSSYLWNPVVYALSQPRYKSIVLRCLNAGDQSYTTTTSKLKLRQPTRRPPVQKELIVDISQRQGKLTLKT